MSEPAYLTVMIDAVAGTIPFRTGETPAERAARFDLARTLVMAHRPQNALEAAHAARAIATHFAVMDCYARAMQPGLCYEMVTRLRATAAAVARANGMHLPPPRDQRQVAAQPRPSATTGVATDKAVPPPVLH